MKILIADDEPVSLHMLQSLLAKWGYEVLTAKDGDAAWEKLRSPDAPRMALLDWMMPGQNGVDVCRALRKLRPEPYTYILLLTAKDAKESVVEGLESGADDYLTKPFNPQELKREFAWDCACSSWRTTWCRLARLCVSRPRTILSPASGIAARFWNPWSGRSRAPGAKVVPSAF
ncbi:MAG TPA: response regulator [Verrucomicrobiae bacterium]|jgi:CheY-like chemotaxis protein|nr:response regulator [Verrucomicrobiae bacterium]